VYLRIHQLFLLNEHIFQSKVMPSTLDRQRT
jgi:hypothetical protein